LPRIVSVYPNPVAPEDRGEYVVLELPSTQQNYTLSDGETTVSVPDATGLVAVSTAPNRTRNLTDNSVRPLEGRLSLANSGERLELTQNRSTLDTLSYPTAPEGERWQPVETAHREPGHEWQPLGATTFEQSVTRDAEVTTFAVPDAPGPAIRAVDSATRRIHVGAYTLASGELADALERAHNRGVDVRIVLEGGPVGGVEEASGRVLTNLNDSGIPVTVIDGPFSRYRFHHPKYAVIDDEVLVASENWGPSGLGGRGHRGWAAIVESPTLATDLEAIFRADTRWRDGVAWPAYRQRTEFQNGSADGGESYPARFPARTVTADRAELVAAPDNAEGRVIELLQSAETSIDIQVVYADRDHPFIREAVAAARRGVRVRVLLGGAWYTREANAKLARKLNERAAREGLTLEAKLAEPRSRYSSVHVKGLIVDREHVLVGSMNWNNVSVRENREVALLLSGDSVGSYYHRLFLADWRGGAWRVPVGTLLILVLGLAGVTALFRRQLAFEQR